MEEKPKSRTTLFSFGQSCFDKKWILQTNELGRISHYICLICRQVANNALESHCPQHEDIKESLIVGEHCLKQYLKDNQNSCPIQPHENSVFLKNKLAQQQIDELIVMCPLQCETDATKGGETVEMVRVCEFKGMLKQLNDHLNKVCPLKVLDCWFKPFGCTHACFRSNLDKHLISAMEFHFGLVMKLIQSITEKLFQSRNDFQFSNLSPQTIISEIEKLMKSIQNKDNEINNLKEYLQFKEKQIIEKDNEVKTLLSEFQRKFENEELLKDLEEKNTKMRQENEQLVKLLNSENKEKEKEEEQGLNGNDNFYFSALKRSPIVSFNSIRSSKVIKTFTGHSNKILSIDYSSFNDRQYLCSGARDKTVRVWDVKTTKELSIFKGHATDVYCVKFSPYHYIRDRCFVICSSSDDKTIRFWNFEIGKEIQVLNGHTKGIACIQFSPFSDGRYLCSGSDDNTIRLWDVETSKSLNIFKGHSNYIWCVEFSPNMTKTTSQSIGAGYTICSGSYDKTIRLWDVETAKELITFKGHDGPVKCVKYSPCGISSIYINRILSGSEDKTVRLWDIRTGKETNVFKGHTNWVYCVEYPQFVDIDTNGSDIVCSGSLDNTIRFWDVRANKQSLGFKGNAVRDRGIICFQFLPLQTNTVSKQNEDNHCSLCYGSFNGIIHIRG
ncbi:WD repeat-containing protein [Reticulomyxa filosa]|uniref:WD repeat-containing protein n=1 Tax=Reticulomyxa filosa TaxID=46433 RepID=X6NJ55_RETFI|nr:WD repeat-containing protein [Reticulomyxa filosa]|eukprot:ETO26350.1 WD repeat-containing protein [Reticulomyxa filosa]